MTPEVISYHCCNCRHQPAENFHVVSTFARHLKEAMAFSICLLITWKLPTTHPSPRIESYIVLRIRIPPNGHYS